jgi:hypothetical protein
VQSLEFIYSDLVPVWQDLVPSDPVIVYSSPIKISDQPGAFGLNASAAVWQLADIRLLNSLSWRACNLTVWAGDSFATAAPLMAAAAQSLAVDGPTVQAGSLRPGYEPTPLAQAPPLCEELRQGSTGGSGTGAATPDTITEPAIAPSGSSGSGAESGGGGGGSGSAISIWAIAAAALLCALPSHLCLCFPPLLPTSASASSHLCFCFFSNIPAACACLLVAAKHTNCYDASMKGQRTLILCAA